jgi:hypothetical protein
MTPALPYTVDRASHPVTCGCNAPAPNGLGECRRCFRLVAADNPTSVKRATR